MDTPSLTSTPALRRLLPLVIFLRIWGARYLEFENLRQDTAYDFLLRPPTTASSGRFLCHEVPLSANIARLMPPPWRPFFAPFSASD